MTAGSSVSVDKVEAEQLHSWRNPAFVRVLLFVLPYVVFLDLVSAVVGLKQSFLIKEQLGIGATQLGYLNLILGIPGYVQPFIGAWTDAFAFLGFHRRSYFITAKLVAVSGYLGLAFLEHFPGGIRPGQTSLLSVTALLLLIISGAYVRNVIFNAIVVKLGNVTGRFGQLIAAISLIPILMRIGGTANLSGFIADHWSYSRAFLVGAILTLLSTPIVFLIDEKRINSKREASETQQDHEDRLTIKVQERREILASMVTAFRSPGLWALVGYVFYLILTPGVNNTKVYFYQDHLKFSREFIGHLGFYANIGALTGYFLYGLVSRRVPVYMLVWGAFLMDCVGYPALLLMRGVQSAKAMEVTYSIIGALYNVCLFTLAARMCPKKLEGVIYGLVMSAIVFASMLSELLGAKLYDYYGPQNIAHHYSLQHGWQWSCWFGFAFTLFSVVFIPFLPSWTRSRKLVGELTDEDIEGKLASA